MHSISEHAIHLIEIPIIYIHHVFLPAVIGFNDYEILIDLEMFFMQHLKKNCYCSYLNMMYWLCVTDFSNLKIRDLTWLQVLYNTLTNVSICQIYTLNVQNTIDTSWCYHIRNLSDNNNTSVHIDMFVCSWASSLLHNRNLFLFFSFGHYIS